MNHATTPDHLQLDLTWQEPIPPAGVQAAMALMDSAKLHRYGETGAKPGEAAALEADFAAEIGMPYCVAMNSCGSTMFAALRCSGVRPGDKVLSNCFTLAPVPGAIAHAGAVPVLVDVTDDLLIDLDDLRRKAQASGAKTLLLSHMRGHICDMEALTALCAEFGIRLIEDCAHTMGAGWNGKATGTWGMAGCFSLQSYKHANSGEGGLLVTHDADLAAQAVLLSGSYMLYASHVARPGPEVFDRWKYHTPNFSLRMGNLPAALARSQLGGILKERCARWNQRYHWLHDALLGEPHIRLPLRPPQEQFVGSSLQFSLVDMDRAQMQAAVAACARSGVHVKWFGADEPVGFTSVWQHWRYFEDEQTLPHAQQILKSLCDLRLPLSLSQNNCVDVGQTIREAVRNASISPAANST
jgi:dTDP-4-amino-4,6-dideoxygalactose transaminase